MKKRNSKIISFLLAFVMLAEISVQYGYADTKSDLQKDADANRSKLSQAQSEAENIESEKAGAEAELENAQQQLVQLLAEVDILKSDIENKKAEIAQAEEDYEAAKKEEERQYNTMRARIKYMYENGSNSSTEYLDILLHAESLTDALNKAAYAEKLAEYDRNMLNKFIEAKEAVAERQRALEDDLSELEEEQTDLEEREQELNTTIEEQRASIENFSSKLAAAKSEAKAYQKKIEEDNIKIAKIVAAEKEAARKKAEEEAARKKAAEEAAKKKAAEEASRASEQSKKQEEASKAATEEKAETKTAEKTEEQSVEKAPEQEEEPEEKQEEKSEEKTEEKSEEPEEKQESSSSSGSGKGSEIASYAQQFIGNPYVPGGTSLTDGCDCSGFVQSVYSHFGYSLPRQSGAQGASGRAVNGMENAQPGDIFYYVGHVGIYIGNGYIVHASTPATGIKITTATYRSVSSIRRIV